MRIVVLFFLAFLDLIVASGAWAQPVQIDLYMNAVEPKRRAFLVGNSAYTQDAALPGSSVDVDKMDGVLRGLGFEVTNVKDVKTRTQFIALHFLPFVESINDGDVIIFYFSGHGFNYAGENFLMPLEYSKPLSSREIFGTFLAVRNLHDLIAERRPSFLLVLLDACRNVSNFIRDEDAADRNRVAKGLTAAARSGENTVISYSTDAGAVSIGSSTATLSVYTEVLAEQLPKKTVLDRILKDVRSFVRHKTGNQQVPWLSSSSSAEVYFSPTPQVIDDQKSLWRVVLEQGVRLSVQHFLDLYGAGPYGAAARRWLATETNAPIARASPVSPAAVELAWASPAAAGSLFAIDGDLAPSAIADFSEFTTANRPPSNFNATAASLDGPQRERVAARALAELQSAVTTKQIVARVAPSESARVAVNLNSGEPLTIDAVEIDTRSNVWLKTRKAAGDASFYVKLNSRPELRWTAGIGRSDTEVHLSSSSGRLNSLVDTLPLVRAVEKIKAQGRSIRWVSIATVEPKTKADKALFDLRAAHVASVLTQNGVPQGSITTLNGDAAVGDGVRVRIFSQ